MNKETRHYIEIANEILFVLQKDGPMKPAGYAVVIGMVAAKMVEAMVENGEDKQKAIDAICKSVQIMSE